MKPRLSHGRLTNLASAPLLTRPRVSALAPDAKQHKECGFAVRAVTDTPPVCPVAAPHSCKYTQEGSVAYYVVKHIAQVDRRMKMLADVEVKPTAAEMAQWTEDAKKWSEEQMKAGQPAAAAH